MNLPTLAAALVLLTGSAGADDITDHGCANDFLYSASWFGTRSPQQRWPKP